MTGTINWHPNPLLTTVALMDADKAKLRTSLRQSALEEYDAENPTEAMIADYVERFYNWSVEELEGGEHCGDCTCVPMTCAKCLAENWLGINTIAGCGKHQLYKIRDAFREGAGSHEDIEQALRALQNYDPSPTWEGWEVHLPRWQAEARKALEWLTAYRDKHFPCGGEAKP